VFSESKATTTKTERNRTLKQTDMPKILK